MKKEIVIQLKVIENENWEIEDVYFAVNDLPENEELIPIEELEQLKSLGLHYQKPDKQYIRLISDRIGRNIGIRFNDQAKIKKLKELFDNL